MFEVLFDTFHGILVHLLHILRYFRILAFKKKMGTSSCRRPGRKAWQCNASHSQAVRFGYLREVRVKACSEDGILVFTDDRCPLFTLLCERKIRPLVQNVRCATLLKRTCETGACDPKHIKHQCMLSKPQTVSNRIFF